MTKEMIISSNGHETMVAILEDDLVAEMFVERERQRGVVGNVYKGRVSKVLPGMQSSFVDIGLERDGFLYVADVIDTLEEFEKLAGEDEDEPHRTGRRGRGGGRGRRAAESARSRAGPGQAPADDRGSAARRPGDSRPGRQGAARHQGRAPDVARDDGRPLSGVHADGRSRRRVAEDRVARGARAVCAASSASSATRTVSLAASSSGQPPPADPRRTSSATSRRSTRSGPTSASRRSRPARLPSCTASRAWSASCCATC